MIYSLKLDYPGRRNLNQPAQKMTNLQIQQQISFQTLILSKLNTTKDSYQLSINKDFTLNLKICENIICALLYITLARDEQ